MSFILERARRLNERYSFSAQKSLSRIDSCMEALREYGCYPTFAVPGIVVERNLDSILRLQEAGAEIAVHGYNHVDLKAYPPEESSRQLKRAADLFWTSGLEVHGFRCPYLSASDDLIKALPKGVFGYSSNKAFQWPIEESWTVPESLMYETIESFYAPSKAESAICLPWFQDGIVEIPVWVPDDLQLHDGLGYGLEQISQVWLDILERTYQRGELFNLMFHPELASFCEAPFVRVLQAASTLQPKVWLARLQEVSKWWKEKADFRVDAYFFEGNYYLKFKCSPRATVLCRGFNPNVPVSRWDDHYWRLEKHFHTISSPAMPFIGLPAGTPEQVLATLRGMGYVLEVGENARQCSLYLDQDRLEQLKNPVELIDYIESTTEPLVRFWPWPDGTRSALCITGDLDALSFFDYAIRLVKR